MYNQNQYLKPNNTGFQPYYSSTGGYPQQQQQPVYGQQQGTPSPQAGYIPFSPYASGTAPSSQTPGMLPMEQSYIENIFRLNKGKLVTIYAYFDVAEANASEKVFKGLIEAAGRDHIIISDPQTGIRYLIPMVYFGYATFDEEIEYDYPFGGGMPGIVTYPPR